MTATVNSPPSCDDQVARLAHHADASVGCVNVRALRGVENASVDYALDAADGADVPDLGSTLE
jgi:hypothetical protein